MATYNLNWSNREFDAVAQTLHESRATVIALQETTPNLERYLQSRLKTDYPHQHYTSFRDQFFGERFGLLSKVPLKNVRFHPPRHGLFGFLTAEFSWEGRTVRLFNVHLQPFEVAPDWTVFRQLDNIEEVHRAEIGEVLHRVHPDQPTLIVGDFNSPSAFAAPEEVRKSGFRDSFAGQFESTTEADKHPTWRWPVGERELNLRIDYIFPSPHWTTRESRLGEFEYSDHRMLMSILELKMAPPEAK